MPPRYHRRIRLNLEAYRIAGTAWLVTIGTANRAPVFANLALGTDVGAMIEERCAKRGAVLDAYCLMPDHAHCIIQVTTQGAGLVDVIRDVKSCSTRVWWRHGGTGPMWQRSFHDHGLRTARDYDRALAYLFDNPVRAGLVEEWSAYPLIGGKVLDAE
jgi:REP element-mobilizing transposase RayT